MVPDEHKTDVLGAIYDTLLSALAGGLPEGETMVTADDVLDFFAMASAAVIDEDDHLRTPRDLRLASETVGKRVDSWVKGFREVNVKAGRPALHLILDRAAQAAEADRGPTAKVH